MVIVGNGQLSPFLLLMGVKELGFILDHYERLMIPNYIPQEMQQIFLFDVWQQELDEMKQVETESDQNGLVCPELSELVVNWLMLPLKSLTDDLGTSLDS